MGGIGLPHEEELCITTGCMHTYVEIVADNFFQVVVPERGDVYDYDLVQILEWWVESHDAIEQCGGDHAFFMQVVICIIMRIEATEHHSKRFPRPLVSFQAGIPPALDAKFWAAECMKKYQSRP